MRSARIRTWSVLLMLAMGVWGVALAAGPAAAGGGCHVPLTDGSGVVVTASELCFTPTVIRVPAGATVTWTNDDSFDHTVTGVGGAWGSYDALRPNRTVSHEFDTAGVFPYYCAIHPGMVGAVVVGNGRPATTSTAGAVAPPPSVGSSPAAAGASAASPAASSDAWRIVALSALALLVAVAVLAVRRRSATGRAQPEHTAG